MNLLKYISLNIKRKKEYYIKKGVKKGVYIDYLFLGRIYFIIYGFLVQI
jgi:hypothetical protein